MKWPEFENSRDPLKNWVFENCKDKVKWQESLNWWDSLKKLDAEKVFEGVNEWLWLKSRDGEKGEDFVKFPDIENNPVLVNSVVFEKSSVLENIPEPVK